MPNLTEEEIADIRRALEFFKTVLVNRGDMGITAAGLYNAAMDAVKKLESQGDET
jgi:hypothetical protein